MRNMSALRALFLAAGLAAATPGLATATGLAGSVNNPPATGSAFAHPMAVTQAREHGLPGPAGRSASATGNPLATPMGLSGGGPAPQGAQAAAPEPVGNSANARGGFGTGPRLG